MTALAADLSRNGWWYAGRAAGIVALLLVTASVLLGLVMSTRATHTPRLRRRARALHEDLALGGLVAIAVHGLTLLGDAWLRPGLAGISIPFVMGYRPLWTGLGIIGGWLAALLGLSFYARRWIGARRWRALHRATALVYVLGLVHAIGAGTDATAPWLRPVLIGSAIPVGALLGLRLAGGRARRRPSCDVAGA